jgi:hypothetical protein
MALTVIPKDDQQKKSPVLILKILPKYNDPGLLPYHRA